MVKRVGYTSSCAAEIYALKTETVTDL